MTHYDIKMGNDITSNAHCDIMMDNNVVMGTYHDVRMLTDVARIIIYYVLLQPIIIFMLS